MDVYQISPGVLALVRGPEKGSNAGLIRTSDGVVAVDSTSDVKSMQEFLRAARVQRQDVRLVINTHFHGDHVGGNALFDCPILAHRLCRDKIAQRRSAQAQRILPTEVLEERRDLEMGGARLEVIHFGGHTPCSTVVWLPESQALLAGDLIFAGRYPYLGDANGSAELTSKRAKACGGPQATARVGRANHRAWSRPAVRRGRDRCAD